MVEYIYCNKVGSGPEHPDKRWGLFSKVLTEKQARARYELNAAKRGRWFGIVRVEDDRPTSYLQICPRANGVKLQRINRAGSIDVSYIWGAYYDPAKSTMLYTGNQDSVFLGQITSYAYPNEDEYFGQDECLGLVMLNFWEDGRGEEEIVTSRPFGVPDEVQRREFWDVPVADNWFKIPEFGDWDAFFHPERALSQDIPS